MMVGFVFGVFIGFVIGVAAVCVTWANDEKKTVRRGFFEHDGEFYRLTRISLWDNNKDELWHEVWTDKEEKL